LGKPQASRRHGRFFAGFAGPKHGTPLVHLHADRGASFPKFRFNPAIDVAERANMISIGTSIFKDWDMNGF
jgi:hypothetical protein